VALETAKLGITVNAVCPSYTDTEMSRSGIKAVSSRIGVSEEEATRILIRNIPRGSFIEPEEVANAVSWLCSPKATAITGQAIVVGGGEYV
jgi:3-hydroxybutyrate dehydrogenase